MTGLLRAQVLQLTRQTGPLWGVLGTSLLLAAISALVSTAYRSSLAGGSASVTDAMIRETPGAGYPFVQLVLGATLITLVTNEWASGSIISTVTTTQRRSAIAISKAIAGAGAALLSLCVGALLALLVARTVFSTADHGFNLNSALEWRHVTGLVTAGVLTTLMAVGIGLILRRTAAAIVTYIALVLVLPIALGPISWEPVARLASVLPLNAAGYLMSTSPSGPTGLTPIQGLLALLTWALASLLAGWWRTVCTDI